MTGPRIPGGRYKGPKINSLKNRTLSKMLPYGSLILVCSVIFVVLLSNVLERWILRRLYPKTWQRLLASGNERRRRSFTYYHIGAIMMFILLCTSVFPVLSFLVGNADFSTHIDRRSSRITVGDMLFVFSEVYTSYYLYEMCFRTQFASPITIAHHIGLLIIVQTSLALFADIRRHPDATMEFFMCMVWGMFDLISEIPVLVSMIVWRVKSRNHVLRSRLAYFCCAWVVAAATAEVSVTVFLLQKSWPLWSLAFRVVTPIIFILWITTQLYGASRLFMMGRSEGKIAYNEEQDKRSAAASSAPTYLVDEDEMDNRRMGSDPDGIFVRMDQDTQRMMKSGHIPLT
ncbi:unnamed protein product [Clonostachys chloroleuca]|uniref:TLC domain-containing protein n=1 Tax=Clonostachys chloroleuca TaxID=1926264 RepID=A0AA35Q1X8_9HYPO|nr:unnamed protein product [Clonostachys chloroleuca]